MLDPLWVWNSLDDALKCELKAGKLQQYAGLQRLLIDGQAAEAENWALRQACEDVVFDSETRMD